MSDSRIYDSSFKYAFIDRIFMVFFVPFVLCLGLAIFFQDFDPRLLGISLFFGLISLVFVLKYWLTGVSSVSLGSEGIVFTYRRNGEDERFRWRDFDLIGEMSSGWLFEIKHGRELILRERYYSDDDWSDLSAEIRRWRSWQAEQELSQAPFETLSKEFVFKPRYEKKFWWAVGIGILSGVGMYLEISPSPRHHPIEGLVIATATSCFAIYMIFRLPRRIRLNEQIVVQRYFLPSKKIFYHEIKDVTPLAIYTSHGTILLGLMLNAYVLHVLLTKKMQEGRMQKNQFTGHTGAIKWTDAKAVLLASVITPIIISGLHYFLEDLRPWRFPLLLWLGIFLLTYFVISSVLTKKAGSEDVL